MKIFLDTANLDEIREAKSMGLLDGVTTNRHPIHSIEAAKASADIATMPYKVFGQLFNHPLTEKGQVKFLKDWDQVAELVR